VTSHRTSGESAALALATLLGVGRAPVVPGTAGSLVALAPAALALVWLPFWAYGLLTAALAVAAVWSAGIAERVLGRHDPGSVVIDEAAGMFVSLWGLPPGGATIAAAFLLFRVMDVFKPPPAGRAERLPGGLGIVADDLVAGAYANLIVRGLVLVYRTVAT
jgi:phosphatidylglycerophosphatase A